VEDISLDPNAFMYGKCVRSLSSYPATRWGGKRDNPNQKLIGFGVCATLSTN